MGPFGRNLFSGRPCLFCFSNNLSHHRNLFSSSNKNHTETKLNEPFSLLFVNPTQRLTSNMPASGVKVADECIDSYEAMKQKRLHTFLGLSPSCPNEPRLPLRVLRRALRNVRGRSSQQTHLHRLLPGRSQRQEEDALRLFQGRPQKQTHR